MGKIAIVYWSGTGNTEAMANFVAEGAGGQADLFTPGEFSADLVSNYSALAFGCPSMGAEQLEEAEFEPMFEAVKPRLSGKTIGLFGGVDVKGAVLVNAVTGECVYYDEEDIPSWVDHVYSADLILQQYDYYGRYHNGFINSVLGQRDVTVTTQGYNYIAQDGDVYMYSGVTSAGTDASNVGFILSNQRTKETQC